MFSEANSRCTFENDIVGRTRNNTKKRKRVWSETALDRSMLSETSLHVQRTPDKCRATPRCAGREPSISAECHSANVFGKVYPSVKRKLCGKSSSEAEPRYMDRTHGIWI